MQMSQKTYDSLYAAWWEGGCLLAKVSFGKASGDAWDALCWGKEKCTFELLSSGHSQGHRFTCRWKGQCPTQLSDEDSSSTNLIFLIWNIAVPGGYTAYFWTLSEHCYISLTFAFTCLHAISAAGIQIVNFLQHNSLVLCRNCPLCANSCWIHQEWDCLSSDLLSWPYFHFSSLNCE